MTETNYPIDRTALLIVDPYNNTLTKRCPSVWQLIATTILLSFFGCGKSEQP